MNIISLLFFWFIGLIVTSFTLLPILIILFFGIPTTLKLDKSHALKEGHGIIRRYFISTLILGAVFLTMLFITYFLFPNGLVGILIGGGMVCLLGLGKIGRNESNIQDYIETNKDMILTDTETVKSLIFDR